MVPPVKSTPKFSPFIATPAIDTITNTSEIISASLRNFIKSMILPSDFSAMVDWLLSVFSVFFVVISKLLNRQFLNWLIAVKIVYNGSCSDNSSKHRGNNPNR